VAAITAEIEAMAAAASARSAQADGEQAGRGQDRDPERLHRGPHQRQDGKTLKALLEGARSTVFEAESNPQRQEALARGQLQPSGSLTVDDGAVRALRRGSSLLPAGVAAVDGGFARRCRQSPDPGRTAIAKGLVAYDAADARRIMGRQSDTIESILGYRGRDEMIHRDELVLI
jgi:glutamate 5-kinase